MYCIQETRDLSWEVGREFMDLGHYIHNRTDQTCMQKAEVMLHSEYDINCVLLNIMVVMCIHILVAAGVIC